MTKDMSVLQLVLYVMFLTVLLAWSATGHVAVRADLTHIDSARGFTKRDLLRRMAARTRARVDKRWSPPPGHGRGANDLAVTSSVSRDVDDPNSEYLIHLGIGTPRPQRVALALDTSSDLIWTQCGCAVCFDQPFPVLDSSGSGSQRGVSCFDPVCARGGLPFSGCTVKDNLCFYAYSYPGNSVTTGKIYEDTFIFEAPSGEEVAAVPSLRFGCGMYNKGTFQSNESGVAGFGRGPMSLPSQLKVGKFSHCFTTIFGGSGSSPVFLGTPDSLEAQATGPIQYTPFVPSPDGPNSSLYYLSLKGVTVGKTPLPFDASWFALKDNGTGGTIIDSGTGITTFPRAVFGALRDEFMRQLALPILGADDGQVPCFSTSSSKQKAPTVPKLILHLDGADWDLREENYVVHFDDPDYGTGLCVVIASSGDSDVAIIGNFQQQNMHIEYDLGNNKLGFVPARCDKL